MSFVSMEEMTLAAGPQLDGFSRLRVSSPYTLFDAQQEYGLDTLRVWDATANGTIAIGQTNGSVTNGSNLVGPRNVNTRLTPITVSTTSGHYSVLQSKVYPRYIPGKSHLVLITGIFSPGTIANCDANSGYFDSANGIFLKVTNGVYSFVRRTSTSGSVVDTEVLQSAWSIDHFDGTGVTNPSGVTLDLTKMQILFIEAEWLGSGGVTVGFRINKVFYEAHRFEAANTLTVPYAQSFNLPVRMELRNTGTSTGTPTIQFCCCSVQTEGGVEPRGFAHSAPGSGLLPAAIAVTTRRPVLSIRPKALYNAVTNRAHIEQVVAALRATTNDAVLELVIGGTLTGPTWIPVGTRYTAGSFVVGISYIIITVGTTDFTLIGAASNAVGVIFTATGVGTGTGVATPQESVAEYDIASTAIAGGYTIKQAFIPSAAGIVSGTIETEFDLSTPLVLSKIDALAATQTALSIVCTSVTGTSNITSILNWQEQVI